MDRCFLTQRFLATQYKLNNGRPNNGSILQVQGHIKQGQGINLAWEQLVETSNVTLFSFKIQFRYLY